MSPRHRWSVLGSRAFAATVAVLVSMLAGIVTGAGTARAGSASGPPDCAAAPAHAACGFYVTGVDGTRELAGTNTLSPSSIAVGTSVVQSATVALSPHTESAGSQSATVGVLSVTLAWGGIFRGPITGISPPNGGNLQVTQVGSAVTWSNADNTPLPVGFTASLTTTATSTGSSSCTKCIAFDAGWNVNTVGSGADGEGDSRSDFVDVVGGSSPTAAFTAAQAAPASEPGKYQFVSDSTSPDGSALDYHWDFGDGSAGTGATVVHTYLKPGTFSASLRVTSSGSGQSASVAHPITVDPPTLQTGVAFVDAHGKVLSSLTPEIGDTVRVRLSVSTTNGVGSISSITFAGGNPLVVTPAAAASIGDPSMPVPAKLTLKPQASFTTTFPATVRTNGLARFTAKPSGKDAAGRAVIGGTGQASYSVSGMTATITVSPATFALVEDAHGPKPIDVTVTETINNTTGAPLTHVVLQSLEPQRTSVGELLAVTYKSGANPADPKLKGNGLPLADMAAGGHDEVTAVYTVSDDGKVDFTSLVTAAAGDATVRAVAKRRLQADPKYYLKVESHVAAPKKGLLPAGSPIVITGRVVNLTDSDTETVVPLYAQVEGNAGLQSFAWNTTGSDPKALDAAQPITLDPGEGRDFTLKVLTAYSEPVAGGSPLTEKPASGGTRAIVRFTPWVTVTRDDGTTFDTDKVDTAGTDESTGDILSSTADLIHTVSIDDSIALPESDPVAVAQGVLLGAIQGVWNGAAGMVTGLIALPKMSVSTLLAIVQYQDRVWDSFTPEQQREFSRSGATLALSGAVLNANYEFAKEGLPALERKIGDGIYQYFTKVENESRIGNYSEVVRLYTSFATDALTQAVLPVALGELAKSKTAVAAVDAAAEAEDAKAAAVVDRVSDAATVEQAYNSVHDVASGIDLAVQAVTRMFGIAPAELAELQALADKYNVLMVVRSRAASSLKWIEEFAAVLKPEAIKIKSVSNLDVALGYDSAWEGSLVFKEPQPLIELRERGGSLTDLTKAFVESKGFAPGTAEYDNAMARMNDRVQEWQKWSKTYFKWGEQKWIDTSFNWKGNAMRDPTVGGSGRFSGFRLVPVDGQESTYIMKMYNPKTGTYVPITGDIDPIAFTHIDGAPLSREEHAALVNEMRTNPLLQSQHGESATYVNGGTGFIAKQFKPGEAALMLAPGKALPRTVRFNPALSTWRSALDYHLVWDGGFVGAGANPAARASLRLTLDADGAAAAAALADKAQPLPGNGTASEPNVGRCSVTYDASATPTFMTAAGTLDAVAGAGLQVSPLESTCLRDGPVVPVRVSPATVTAGSVPAGASEIQIAGGSAYGQRADGGDGFQVGQTVIVDPGSSRAETGRIAAFGSIILSRALRHDHPAGTVIVTVRPAAPSSPALAATGLPDEARTIALGLGALVGGTLLTAGGTTRRRRSPRAPSQSDSEQGSLGRRRRCAALPRAGLLRLCGQLDRQPEEHTGAPICEHPRHRRALRTR